MDACRVYALNNLSVEFQEKAAKITAKWKKLTRSDKSVDAEDASAADTVTDTDFICCLNHHPSYDRCRWCSAVLSLLGWTGARSLMSWVYELGLRGFGFDEHFRRIENVHYVQLLCINTFEYCVQAIDAFHSHHLMLSPPD